MRQTVILAHGEPSIGVWRSRFIAITLCMALVVVTWWCSGCRVAGSGDVRVEDESYSVAFSTQLPPQIVIPLSQHNGYLRTRVKINRENAGLFMLDTGSAHSAIAPVVAKQLGLPKGESGIASGIGGYQGFNYYQINRFSIRGVNLASDRLAGLDDLYGISHAFGGFLSGIIGYSSFGEALFTIDYQSLTLTVHNPRTYRPDESARSEPIWVYGGVPVVRAWLGQGHEVWLIVDTGADNHIALPLSVAIKWPDIVLTPASGRGRSKGVGGSVGNIRGWLTSVKLFGVELEHVPVSFEKNHPSINSQGRIIGRIGGHLLKQFRLTFDRTNNRLWIQNLKRDHARTTDGSSSI